MVSDMLTNPGLWVAIGLPLSGFVALISRRMARRKRAHLMDSLVSLLERPDINAADVAIAETFATVYRSKRGWAAVPIAPLAAIAFIPIGLYRLISKGPDHLFDWVVDFETLSLFNEVTHATGIDPTKATVWGTQELKDLWRATSNSMQHETPLSHIWFAIWFIPVLLLFAFILIALGHSPKGPKAVLRRTLGRMTDFEQMLKA